MKKTWMLFMAGLIAQLALAQVKEGTVVYERKTNMHKRLPPENENMKSMIPEFSISRQQLVFSGDESLYSTKPEQEDIRDHAGEEPGRINIRMNGGSNETYKNYATESLTEIRELGPKKYIIEDTLRKLFWKLQEDTMLLQGFHCKKAIAKTRQGDNVIAWYTKEIGSSSGPEQFGGLPGLILQMDIGESWIVFNAIDIKTGTGKQVVKAPSGAKKITRQAFQKMEEEAFGPSSGGPRVRIITRQN